MSSSPLPLEVILSFQGQKAHRSVIPSVTTVQELAGTVRSCFSLSPDASLKLLYKGKDLLRNKHDSDVALFDDSGEASGSPASFKSPIKLLVLSSTTETVVDLNSGRSDPTIRGLDHPAQPPTKTNKDTTNIWNMAPDKNYKFSRFEACTWQSFGHRASDTHTPHAFRAMELLQQLATDPGIVAILRERELVVGTLGEMDPIDDRLLQRSSQAGACLLGYNTNHGARIDLKLRPDSLQGFLPYPQIVATLIHELSHNWVGAHDVLFWTNYGQMRVEYFHTHASLAATGFLTSGRTTQQLAGVYLSDGMKSIFHVVMAELKTEMMQHGLQAELIATVILDRCRELVSQSRGSELGRIVGGETENGSGRNRQNPRELALAAAERRARQTKENGKKGDNKFA
jgi:hypothetical protein